MSLLEKFVTQWLTEADLDFLNQLCTEYNIVIPAAKVGKHQEILKLLLRYVTGEELENTDDQGAAVYLKLFNDLDMALGKGTPKSEPSVDGGVVGAGSSTISYHKLRELKITGSIDGGKEGTLSYTSLSCQLKQAEVAGCSTAEVIAAVIKAIPTGRSFRTLLESKPGLEQEDFMKLLRSHYKEKDSAAVLQLLLNCYQEPGQDAHEFCCMAMSLRDRVMVLSEEEGNPEDEEVLTKRLYHTIFTGLKQNSIRMELHNVIKNANLTDVDFLERVSMAEANETERLEKVKMKAEIALLTEQPGSQSGGKKVQPSSQQTSASNKQKNASAQPENSVVDKKLDLLVSKLDSLTSLSHEQATRISVLETKLATGQSTSGPGAGFGSNAGQFAGRSNINTNAHAQSGAFGSQPGAFGNPTGASNQNTSNRRIFKCPACLSGRVGYCQHCLKCGSDQHRVKDCPEN